MKRIFSTLIGLLAFLFLSCSGDIKISIYTRDLSDVISAKEKVIYTNVNMIVESLKDESDIEFLRNNLNGFSNEHEVEYNYSTSLSFDIKVPIVTEKTTLDFSKDLIIIFCKKNGDKTDYFLKYNGELFSKINNYIYNTHYQNIDLTKFKLLLEISNDERKTISLTAYSSYINGKAYPFSHVETLKERDKISLEVSEIFAKYISAMSDNYYPVFSIN